MDDWDTTPRWPNGRLTPQMIRQARALYDPDGLTYEAVGRQLGIAPTTARKAVQQDPEMNLHPEPRHRDYDMRAINPLDSVAMTAMVAEIDRALWSPSLKRERGLL